jgi:hypothetical protein
MAIAKRRKPWVLTVCASSLEDRGNVLKKNVATVQRQVSRGLTQNMHDQKIAVFLWHLLLRDRGCVYMEYMMICTYLQQALKEYLIWSLILNSYFTKPLKKWK